MVQRPVSRIDLLGFHIIELAIGFFTLVNPDPEAILMWEDLALPKIAAATGPVAQVLCTFLFRTQKRGIGQGAVAAMMAAAG